MFEKPIKLKSGRLSYWYVNWRNIAEDVFLTDKLTDYIIAFIEFLKLKTDCIYGVPEGATKLGIISQYKWAQKQPDYDKGIYRLAMGRAQPKGHGEPKDQNYLGIPRGMVTVIEDTLTTGESLLKTLNNLKISNIKIAAAICLTNRNELRDDGKNIEHIFKTKGINFYSMSNAVELLPMACQKQKPAPEIKRNIEEYFDKYGVRKISLK
ncbi:MAG: hypothetical protein EU539_13245 [Promethearchaeota archaeon]|nr:MAG: hypothetical protein EU539_13245 [Candidatus Lokiarchaeota archaeon]